MAESATDVQVERSIKGAVPIIVVFFLLTLGVKAAVSVATYVVISVICCAILWFGRNWLRGTLVTKWIGFLLAIYASLVPGLLALGFALRISIVFIVVLFLALPFFIYDLLFRQPGKGRIASERESRHIHM
jgi:hypothetical protein